MFGCYVLRVLGLLVERREEGRRGAMTAARVLCTHMRGEAFSRVTGKCVIVVGVLVVCLCRRSALAAGKVLHNVRCRTTASGCLW